MNSARLVVACSFCSFFENSSDNIVVALDLVPVSFIAGAECFGTVLCSIGSISRRYLYLYVFLGKKLTTGIWPIPNQNRDLPVSNMYDSWDYTPKIFTSFVAAVYFNILRQLMQRYLWDLKIRIRCVLTFSWCLPGTLSNAVLFFKAQFQLDPYMSALMEIQLWPIEFQTIPIFYSVRFKFSTFCNYGLCSIFEALRHSILCTCRFPVFPFSQRLILPSLVFRCFPDHNLSFLCRILDDPLCG